MKILDVDLFQDGIQRNITMLDRLSSEMEAIHHAVNGLVQMEDQLKGAGGNAIRSFYQECHLPFLHFFQLFSEQFKQVLNQMEAALHSLEPDSSGYILETFLDGELEQGLTLIGELTASLTDEANSIMNQVSDIVALPHLDDSGVQEGVISSKRKRDDTLMQLYEFDALQTFALNPIEHGLQTMDTWLTDIEGLFTDGVTDIDFRSNQWAAISMNSGLKTAIEQQTSRVNGGLESSNQENLIGTEITPGTFRALEGKKTKTIHRGAYGSFNLLKFHLYENGLIIKEYQLGTSKPIQYVVVKEVEEEFEDGGVRELDGYFEGTKLAFVDYLRPHAIVKKGFKLAFISGAKISKYKGDLSVRKTPTVENKSKGSVNGSKEAGNPNKGTGKAATKQTIKQNEVTTYKDFVDRSVVGDNLEGHEVWQHANLKANGLATNRLSTEASKNNPVIALEREHHKLINKVQRGIDATNQLPLDNITSNSKILRDAGISEDIVNDITNKALNHMKNTLE